MRTASATYLSYFICCANDQWEPDFEALFCYSDESVDEKQNNFSKKTATLRKYPYWDYTTYCSKHTEEINP